ncbi:MAG: CobD/CbiB family cobalamin biosynthesis protein [Ruthenibacterium lactatiformans]
MLPLGTLGLAAGALWLCGLAHPALRFALEALWCWQALAAKCLRDESRNVCRALTDATLPEARAAVARIVGRDTDSLSAEGVARAAVETVAENFSDGEIAPLFYMLLGGAPLALCYKAINTMDSMVGTEQRYLFRARGRKAGRRGQLSARPHGCALLAGAAALWGRSRAARAHRRRDRQPCQPNSARRRR